MSFIKVPLCPVNTSSSTALHKAQPGLVVAKVDKYPPLKNGIVWCPTSTLAPTKMFTLSQAKAVAIKMSEQNPDHEFYWLEIKGSVLLKN